ncbi:MAG: TRAP transporter small permease [Pseudomonadota bacterium]
MRQVLDTLFRAIYAACRVILGLLTSVVLITVFGRYVLNATPRWGEETALMLLVWLSLLAVPLGIRNRWHIKLDILMRVLPATVLSFLAAVNWSLSFLFGLAAIWYGIHIAIQNLSNLMPGLGISAFWQYLSVPICGVLVVIALLEIMFDQFYKSDTKQTTAEEGDEP